MRKIERDRNFDSYNKNFLNGLDDSGRATLDNAGITLDSINKAKTNFDTQASTGVVDSKTAAQLGLMVSQYRDKKMSEFEDYIGKTRTNAKGESFTIAGLIGPEYVEKMRKSVTEKLDSQTKPIIDNDKGRLNFQVTANEATINQSVAELYNSSDQIKRMAATHKALGDQVSNTLLWSSTPGMSAVKSWFSSYIVGGISTKQTIDNLFDDGAAQMTKAGVTKEDQAHVNRDVITKMATGLRDKNLTPEGASLIVNSLFSGDPRAKDFYARASDVRPGIGVLSDREVLYRKLVDPAVTEAVFKTGNGETIQRYTRWVDAATGARVAQEATNLKAAFVDTYNGYRINYDEKSHRFTPEKMTSNVAEPVGSTLAAEAKAYELTSKLNNTMSQWIPVMRNMQKSPEDINHMLSSYFSLQGLDINNIVPKTIPSTLNRPRMHQYKEQE
jgi:hypothetical protein